jgi:hypothetical protein
MLLVLIVLAAPALFVAQAQRADRPPSGPGPQGQGVTLLPDGWRIEPSAPRR